MRSKTRALGAVRMEVPMLPALPTAPQSRGELVVQNGRLSGQRKALLDPRTLIGHSAGCDVRLAAEGVEAVHCAIVQDRDGASLIDLGSSSGTRVNGAAVTVHRLA